MFVDMEDVALDFQNESIQINNIEYFEALFVLLANTTERQLGKLLKKKTIILLNVAYS